MTEAVARRESLEFTGIYVSHYDKPKAKAQAAEIRAAYKCRAVLVDVRSGWSVYADSSYRIQKNVERAQARLSHMPNLKAKLYERYLADLAKYEKEEEEAKAYVESNQRLDLRL